MELKEEIFRHSLPIQIRFNDIDAIGHINNNVYFSYFDLGKVSYFEDIKASYVSWIEGIVVLAHLEVDFLSPIYYKEPLAVDTKALKVGTKSITLLQQLRNVKTQEVKCRCTSVIVAYDANLQASMDIPPVWKEAVLAYDAMD
ncbi:MAG: acyl-CoA thioesterase [Prevotella sp.]|jgi:acyl-CoA thioester hydrolase|nr:acyl-CoA thioesterase [Prevotella sp.]